MKKRIVLIFALLAFQITNAQNTKYGKVSEEDFQKFSTPADPSDKATVIYRSQKIKFDFRKGSGFIQVNEVHERIIIHHKDGFNWATKKVKLYNKTSSQSEELKGLKGYTYNLENGKVVKEKLRSDGVFEEVANKYWKYESFTMPNVTEGSIIEYTYEIESSFLGIDDIDIQYDIPINQFELSITTPEYFIYNKLFNPRASYITQIDESKKNRSVSYTQSNTSDAALHINRNSAEQQEFSFIENVISCNLSAIPALREETLVDNINNYRAKLILELTAIKYPNQPTKTYASTWEDVTKTIYDDVEFGGQLDKSGYFDDDLKALLGDETNLVKKTALIYSFVKSKVKWNGYYGYSTDGGVRKAYKDGVGNTAEINLMLISMLRYAGVKANPILISTRNNGIPLFPTRQGFNYVVCLVESDNFNMILDASEQYSTVNILPTRALNWQGRVVRENGSSAWIDLNVTSNSNKTTSLNVKINPDLNIEGKVRSQMANYLALDYRNKFANISNDDHIKYLESNKGEIEISNLEVKDIKDPNLPVNLTYEYTLTNAIEEIGDKLYFSPMLFLASEENPFKQDTRNYPITIDYPSSRKYMVNIIMPEGYAVESLPESKAIDFNSGAGKFSYIIKENGSFLQLIINFDLNSTIVLPLDYEYFKTFYKEVIEKQTEKVVLKKV